MRKTLLITVALLAIALPALASQKNKVKLKEKRFEPVVKQDASGYAGRYIGIDDSYVLEIEVGADSQVHITSIEGSRRAQLKDIRLDGARITATKVYEDGAEAPFEGLFADRILNGERTFGVVVSKLDIEIDGLKIDRTFYRLFTAGRGK